MWGSAHSAGRLFLFVPPEHLAHVQALLGKQHLYLLKELSDQEASQRDLYTDRPL
jgi:hypothetical protein